MPDFHHMFEIHSCELSYFQCEQASHMNLDMREWLEMK